MVFWKKEASKDKTSYAPGQVVSPTQTSRPKQTSFFRQTVPGLSQVRNIIAVASGKGGVGKSTVSTNLAIALKLQGYQVGLLDADIYGPSQAELMGPDQSLTPKMSGNQLLPVEKHGMKFMSMGVVSHGQGPVVWRAPMALKMVQQFLNVAWGALDYLIVDLPPGTGDVQITLAQQVALTGAVIVSTPQNLALGIASKGLKMFNQVNVPIIGIVENMSGFTCEHCHKETAIFKTKSVKDKAKRLGVPYLGSLPLDPLIMESGDEGVPLLLKNQHSIPAQAFEKLAKRTIQEIELIEKDFHQHGPLDVQIDEKQELWVEWADGGEANYGAYELRVKCPCASCIDENTGDKILDPAKVPLDIKIENVIPIGRYGLSIHFSDGHRTGIFTYELIKSLKTQNQQFTV